MEKEFISLNSKIFLKKGVITQKKLKFDTEQGFERFIAFVALLALLAFCIYSIAVDKKYLFIIQLLLVLIWLEPYFKRIYISLFVRTWKYKIRIDEIQSVTSSIEENGLETKVTLHLKNGRKKFYIFRNAENQLEDFIHSVDAGEFVQQVG